MFYIGIDCGSRNGIALMTDRTELIELASINFKRYGAQGFLDRAENMFRVHNITKFLIDKVII